MARAQAFCMGGHMVKDIDRQIIGDFKAAGVDFVTSVPCKQLAGVIEVLDQTSDILHVPSNKEDEGMGLCAGAYMGGMRPAIFMQNTALGVVVNTLATLIQFYQIPLPMLISYRGELGEPVACQVEMALHTKAILDQMHIQTYHFHKPEDAQELPAILAHTQMSKKPVAILTDASFWRAAT
jgi:sulfopyruvate decarboxylase subunit alpha